MTPDDSLYLGYSSKKGLLTTKDTALSVSVAKLFDEDPLRFYLKKVLKLDEPQSLPLVFGSAGHAAIESFLGSAGTTEHRVKRAMEVFRTNLRGGFSRLENPTVRENPTDLTNPRGKIERAVTLAEVEERGRYLIEPFLLMLGARWDAYTPWMLQADRQTGIEATLGQVAKERGMPTVEMMLYNPRVRRMRKMPAALIAGVPFHGFIDLTMNWTDGTPMIIDHKLVGDVISFYPVGTSGARRSYGSSYDPANDIQLDVYSYATGITRAGFQYLCKRPQYVPATGILSPNWVEESAWNRLPDVSGKLPMAWAANDAGELRYLNVWRPAPQDHPSSPQEWTRPYREAATVSFVRRIAEELTESLILWQNGVEPEVAFPAGKPSKIYKKACPYCVWGPAGDGRCPTPRLTKSDDPYWDARRERERLCQQNKDIMERRALWNA